MLTFVAIPLTCWLCALLAAPCKPLPDHEMQELAYRHLVGRQQLLLACAVVATVAVAIVLVLTALALPSSATGQ